MVGWLVAWLPGWLPGWLRRTVVPTVAQIDKHNANHAVVEGRSDRRTNIVTYEVTLDGFARGQSASPGDQRQCRSTRPDLCAS